MSEQNAAAPLAHVCPHPARPDDHGCHLNDGTPVRGPHVCWHCHDDPPVGHTCSCCGIKAGQRG
jgi:hypothetical protein